MRTLAPGTLTTGGGARAKSDCSCASALSASRAVTNGYRGNLSASKSAAGARACATASTASSSKRISATKTCRDRALRETTFSSVLRLILMRKRSQKSILISTGLSWSRCCSLLPQNESCFKFWFCYSKTFVCVLVAHILNILLTRSLLTRISGHTRPQSSVCYLVCPSCAFLA